MTAASPGVARAGCRTSTTRPRKRTWPRSPTRCGRSTRRSSARASCSSWTARTWGSAGRLRAEHRGASPQHGGAHVEAINHAVANIPAERMRLHVCWGNYEGPHHHDIRSADILDILFNARPAAISFEAANPRHAHEWTVFEDVKLPEGKIADPGRARLDDELHRASRADRPAHRPLRQRWWAARTSIAGSDCGFATWAGPPQVDPDVTWAKLAAMAEGARRASAVLWGRAAG